VPTSFPTFVDTPEGEEPEPGTPDADAAYLNSVNVAINTLENTLPGKVDAGTLATVASSGAYTDLIGSPFIPTAPSHIGAQPAGTYVVPGDLAAYAPVAHTHAAPNKVPVGSINATGTPTASTFLRGDGTWSPPPPDISGGISGAVGDGVVDDTVAINAALTAARTGGGGLVKGAPGSTYLINAPLVIGSNTVLDMTGCRVVLDPAVTQSNMLNNRAVSTSNRTVTDGAIAAAANILVSAAAAWTSADIGRSVHIPGAGWELHGGDETPVCATILSVSGTDAELDTVAGTTVVGATVTIYNRDENILVTGGTWDAGANEGGADNTGRHILRFRRIDDLTVRDLRVECTGGKYAITPGDCNRVKITDCSFDTSSDGIHFHGPARGITIRGITGVMGDDSVAIGTDDIPQYQDVAGPISEVVIEDVDCVTDINIVKIYTRIGIDLNNITIRNIRGRSLGEFTGITLVDGTMDNILVDGVNITGPAGGIFRSVMLACSSSKATVRNVVSSGGFLCQVVTGFTVDSLLVQGAVHSSPTSGDHMVVIDGSVGHLSVSDFSCTLPASASLVRMTNGASIGAAYISDGVLTGVTHGSFLDAQVSSGTLGRAVLRGLRGSSIAFGFATSISGEVNLSDVDLSAAIGLVYVAGGNLVIRNGQGITGTATASFRDAGTLAVRAPDFPIDLDLANSRSAGDRAFNVDAGLSCGVGPVVFNGTAWVNVASGATYTPA
jgi:hypothetical protein